MTSCVIAALSCAAELAPCLTKAVRIRQGTYDASAYRGGQLPTPAVDALVESGLLMDSFYVFQICSPTRSSLVTGRYPFHVSQQLPEGFHAISRQYELLPSLLAKYKNYVTYHVGKWYVVVRVIVPQCSYWMPSGLLPADLG